MAKSEMKRVIVTGGAGFIGSNLARALTRDHKVVIVDDLSQGDKFNNLVGIPIEDYVDVDDFYKNPDEWIDDCEAVFHQGAIADTTVNDGKLMMRENYHKTVELALSCLHYPKIKFIYASSAAVYGNCKVSKEHPENERPLNVYGYSKLLVDNFFRDMQKEHNVKLPLYGLRYFNVYGQGEQFKGKMSSMVFQLFKQFTEEGSVKLFAGTLDSARDFVHVDDVVSVNLHMLKDGTPPGIYNVGTGQARTFKQVTHALVAGTPWADNPTINEIPMPEGIKKKYQHFTQADLTKLRAAGYTKKFMDIEEGVGRSCQEWKKWLS